MKISGNRPPQGPAASTGTKAYAAAQKTAAPQSVTPAGDVSSVLGIPEAEFTPRVRDAIMGLMAEVDRLRGELEQTKARLEATETVADQDGLLPMLNRRAFVRELSRIMSFSARYDVSASLIYFDLDGFKAINDSYGHAAGDAALLHVANLLTANVRESDVVGRLGGDEFGVILAKADREQAEKKAQSLAHLMSDQPFSWQERALPVSFAYGVYTFQKGEDVAAAIANADKAMYEAKRGKTAKRT